MPAANLCISTLQIRRSTYYREALSGRAKQLPLNVAGADGFPKEPASARNPDFTGNKSRVVFINRVYFLGILRLSINVF